MFPSSHGSCWSSWNLLGHDQCYAILATCEDSINTQASGSHCPGLCSHAVSRPEVPTGSGPTFTANQGSGNPSLARSRSPSLFSREETLPGSGLSYTYTGLHTIRYYSRTEASPG